MDDYYDFGYGDSGEFQGSWDSGDDTWFWDSIGIDPSTTGGGGESPSNNEILQQIGYEDPGVVSTITKLLQSAGPKAVNFLKSQYTKPDGSTNWRAVAATAGGLYGAYQASRPKEKTGYQGGIPTYEAVREAVPGSHYDPNRRPGSGGQRYFSDTKYTAPGEAATTARTAAKEQVAGLQALNRENPANQPRRPTEAAAERGQESEQVREGTAASKVSERMPVPKYAHGGIAALAKGGRPRYLSGATDGMADKIPARIDGSQEARLSHGEFVIPADVVGHLGNGNSEAGAQRLYAMMDKIRKARTGTTKQGKQINPNKFLPT